MTFDRDLARAMDRLTDAMTEYAVARVRQALVLERDRMDAEVAELRDEVHTLGEIVYDLRLKVKGANAGELDAIRAELAAMAGRETRMSETVADLMGSLTLVPDGQSVKVRP